MSAKPPVPKAHPRKSTLNGALVPGHRPGSSPVARIATLCWTTYEVTGHENLGAPHPRARCTREPGHEPAPHAGACPLCDPASHAKTQRMFELFEAQNRQ